MKRQKRLPLNAQSVSGPLQLLDNSTVPLEQTDIQRTFQIKVEPTNALPALNSQSPLSFDVPDSTVFYTAASEIYLDIGWKCVHADGTDLQPNEAVSVVSIPFYCMFKDIEVYCNARQISFNTGHAPMIAYLKTLLYQDEQTKLGLLTNVLWRQDAAGTLDLYTPPGANTASDWRSEYIAQSRVVHMHYRLACDVLSSQRLLPPNTQLRIKLFQSPPSFLFMGAAAQQYAIQITSASLYVSRVELSPATISMKEAELAHHGFLYPFLEYRIIEKTAPQNSQKMVAQLFSNEMLPSRLFLVFSRTGALLGDNTKNPMNLMHMNLNNLTVTINGVLAPHVPFTPDFATGSYSREFCELSKCLGSDYKAVLSKSDFGGGYAIFVVSLQPLSVKSNYRSKPFAGHVQVSAQWAQPLPESLTLLAVGLFNATMYIDSQKQVFIRRD